jgi:hypothetical protein
MIEPNPNVLTYRRRVRRYHRRKWTEAERAALQEKFYKTIIATRGLQDSPEVRLLYKLCPEVFFEWTLKDGRIVMNEITTTQLKLIVAVLKAQRMVVNEAEISTLTGLNALRPKSQTVAPVEAVHTEPPLIVQQASQSTRGRKSELTKIWDDNSEKLEAMLAGGHVEELRALIRKEARSCGLSPLGLAKRVREFVDYRQLRLERQRARIS